MTFPPVKSARLSPQSSHSWKTRSSWGVGPRPFGPPAHWGVGGSAASRRRRRAASPPSRTRGTAPPSCSSRGRPSPLRVPRSWARCRASVHRARTPTASAASCPNVVPWRGTGKRRLAGSPGAGPAPARWRDALERVRNDCVTERDSVVPFREATRSTSRRGEPRDDGPLSRLPAPSMGTSGRTTNRGDVTAMAHCILSTRLDLGDGAAAR
jgi:hypothetical protein